MYSDTVGRVSKTEHGTEKGGLRMPRTCGLVQGSSVLNVKVGECAMDVSAHLLTCLGRPKHTDDGHLGLLGRFCVRRVSAKPRVVSGWHRLVVVDAIESDAEHVHLVRLVHLVHLVHLVFLVVHHVVQVTTHAVVRPPREWCPRRRGSASGNQAQGQSIMSGGFKKPCGQKLPKPRRVGTESKQRAASASRP